VLDPSILQSRSDKLKNVLKSHRIVTQEEIEAKMITNDVVATVEVPGMVHETVLETVLEKVLEMVLETVLHPEITLITQL